MKPSFLTAMGLTTLQCAGAFAAAASGPQGTFPGFYPLSPVQVAAVVQVPDVAGLPRVLLIGDSISMAYTLQVRAGLQGVANVHRPDENCGPTVYGLQRIEAWLGAGKWDVIYFNFGLHDLKWLDAQENYVTPDKGRPVATTEVYGRNLRAFVARLRRTGAKMIFASTTPVPAGANGRVEGSERAYNDVAARVMRESGAAVDDLHAYVVPRQSEIQLPHDVHFTPAGSAALAGHVTATLRAALAR